MASLEEVEELKPLKLVAVKKINKRLNKVFDPLVKSTAGKKPAQTVFNSVEEQNQYNAKLADRREKYESGIKAVSSLTIAFMFYVILNQFCHIVNCRI
jgi:hypothetical protein